MADELERVKELGREIPDPGKESMDRARTLLQRRIDVEERRRRPLWRPLHARWALIGGVAALLGSGFGFGLGAWNTDEGSARPSVAGLGFLPAKGWTVVQSTARGQRGATNALAANVPLPARDDLEASVRAAHASLPAHGVLIFATFTSRGDPRDADFARRELPLSLESPAAVTRLRASVGTHNVDVRVYFGSAPPSPQLVEVAQRQLNRLVVASERVTVFARPTILARNQPLTLFGAVDSDKAEEIITVEIRDCGQTSFREVAAARTREGGGWSTEVVNPAISGTFRAVWKNNTSATVPVQVRASVLLRRRDGSSNKFTVGVGAKLQFWRRYAVIERFERRIGLWKPVKKVVLTETASSPGVSSVLTYEDVRITVPKGTLIRAVFPRSQAGSCYLTGYSPQVRT